MQKHTFFKFGAQPLGKQNGFIQIGGIARLGITRLFPDQIEFKAGARLREEQDGITGPSTPDILFICAIVGSGLASPNPTRRPRMIKFCWYGLLGEWRRISWKGSRQLHFLFLLKMIVPENDIWLALLRSDP